MPIRLTRHLARIWWLSLAFQDYTGCQRPNKYYVCFFEPRRRLRSSVTDSTLIASSISDMPCWPVSDEGWCGRGLALLGLGMLELSMATEHAEITLPSLIHVPHTPIFRHVEARLQRCLDIKIIKVCEAPRSICRPFCQWLYSAFMLKVMVSAEETWTIPCSLSFCLQAGPPSYMDRHSGMFLNCPVNKLLGCIGSHITKCRKQHLLPGQIGLDVASEMQLRPGGPSQLSLLTLSTSLGLKPARYSVPIMQKALRISNSHKPIMHEPDGISNRSCSTRYFFLHLPLI